MTQFIALDLGADSGRAIVGTLQGDRLSLQEAYRFPNGPVRLAKHLFWDPLRLFSEIKHGLGLIRQQYGRDIASVGLDTWGIDFALLDREGNLIGNPYCYRDPRTEGMMDQVLQRVSKWEIFEQSGGIQFMTINTLFQLYSMAASKSSALERAQTFLMIPDLLNYWLTGEIACEFTDVTTTQFYDARRGGWARSLLDKLGIPTHIFPNVIMPGAMLGKLLPEIAEEANLGEVPVVAPATHDTASAAVAVPAENAECAWLSSGTWSLLGTYSPDPLVSREALEHNFSSYGGAGGTFLPWKNIMGLWLVNECRRIWAKGGEERSFEDLTRASAAAMPFTSIIDPDHHSFLAPLDMPSAIRKFCVDTQQAVPETKGEIIRTSLEGLAFKYRWTLEKLEKLLGKKFRALHVVGGGSKNRLLCQFTADATGLPVIAGPVEATAIGNIVLQAVAMKELTNLAEARKIIRHSFDVVTFEPGPREEWDRRYGTFSQFVAGSL